MEFTGFEIMIGLVLAIVFVGVGIVIGRTEDNNQSSTENNSNHVRTGIDYNSVHNSRTNYADNSNVGDNNGKVDSGQDMGYAPTAEQVVIVLNTIPKTARLTPHETDCVEWAAKIMEKLIELDGDSDE